MTSNIGDVSVVSDVKSSARLVLSGRHLETK